MKNPKRPSKKHHIKIASHMTSDANVIKSIIFKSISRSPVKIKRIIAGIGNEVYMVSKSSNKDNKVILRINHKNRSGFDLEQWAMKKVVNYGVPVPKIIDIGTSETSDGKVLAYCIEEFLDGENLSNVLDKGVSENERGLYGEKAGKILAKIHKVKTEGWGQFGENGFALQKTLRKSMQQHKDKEKLMKAASAIKLNITKLHEGINIIDKVQTEEEPHLIHTDYAPKHIFVKDGKIVGVIDFEICMSGTASMDINRWRSQDNRIDMRYLIKGYESVKKLASNFWEEMFVIQVHSALRTILFHYYKTRDMREVKKAGEEFEELLSKKKPLTV